MSSRRVGLGLRVVLILNLGRSLGVGIWVTVAAGSYPAGSSMVWIYGHSEGLGGQPATDDYDFPSGTDGAAVRILNSTSEEGGDMITRNEPEGR